MRCFQADGWYQTDNKLSTNSLLQDNIQHLFIPYWTHILAYTHSEAELPHCHVLILKKRNALIVILEDADFVI